MGVSENYQPVKFTVASSWTFYFALLHPNYFELKERKKNRSRIIVSKPASWVKFKFSKKSTKIMKSSPSIWRLLSKCQINGEDFVIFVAILENMKFFGASQAYNKRYTCLMLIKKTC